MRALRWAEIAALPSFFGPSKKMECENCMYEKNKRVLDTVFTTENSCFRLISKL